MQKRGRKSSAQLAVILPEGISAHPRPEPLDGLSDEQSEVWRAIVNRHPADWFSSGSEIVLAQLCRHTVAAHRIAESLAKIEEAEDFDFDLWRDMLAMQDRESARIAQLTTKLRLTPQSRYTPKRAATQGDRSAGNAPWEV